MDLIDVAVTREPLSFDPGPMASMQDGALVTFFGVVRSSTGGRSVERLEYEAYGEMAERQLTEIANEALNKWSVSRVLIHHRTGSLGVGECSVIIAVAAPHRAEAFEACRFCIEGLKSKAAIWKKELFSDGSSEWVEHA